MVSVVVTVSVVVMGLKPIEQAESENQESEAMRHNTKKLHTTLCNLQSKQQKGQGALEL